MHGPLKLAGYLVVLSMASAAVYALCISAMYWPGIGV